MASLKVEIAQKRDFAGPEEEALLNLLRTSDYLQRSMQQTTRAWGLTSTQYNVLRILRGSHPDGLPCAAIGSRMIAAEPDITRLLSRLKALRFVRQHRDKQDRRVVLTVITEAGLDLLRAMDPEVRKAPRELLDHMQSSDLKELTRLLELARLSCRDRPRT